MTAIDKHTPGPWRYWTQRRPESEDTCTFRSVGGAEVLRAVTVTVTEADARLIAAAPDLLGCCRKALAAWTGDGPPIDLDDLRATIAKATGEQAQEASGVDAGAAGAQKTGTAK
jgi:hypothetical protein